MSRFNSTIFLPGLFTLTLISAPLAQAKDFSLHSPTLDSKGFTVRQVFNGFGCTGQNISPALAWENVPAGTKSFAITVYDPDAPTGSGWWHWVTYNIPAQTDHLAENAGNASSGALPAGSVQGRTDFGSAGFGGPCPPIGDKPHRYIFTLHALKVAQIDAPAEASPALIGFMLNANTIKKTSITFKYGRAKP